MIYHLLFPLREYIFGFNVFRYITFRAGAAAVTALLICFVLGPVVIRKLRRSGMIEKIREDGPGSHQKKAPTATMGGLIVLPAVLLGTLLFARLDNLQIWILISATLWMGAVGFLDDYLKTKGKKEGLIPRYKLLGQVTLGLGVGLLLLTAPESISVQFAEYRTTTTLPFFKDTYLDFAPLGISALFVLVTILVITGTSNSVNLTDGLDGLAIGIVGIIAMGLAGLSYVTGHAVLSDYLNIMFLPGSGEITVFCASLTGGALGLLWFSAPPAQVYMGDTGALALGAAVAVVAILIKKELFLVMLGGVLVVESLSVIIQRVYFKYTRRRFGQGVRFFRMAPIHHHFELLGWSESQVVVRFWIVGILLLFLTMTTFKVR